MYVCMYVRTYVCMVMYGYVWLCMVMYGYVMCNVMLCNVL